MTHQNDILRGLQDYFTNRITTYGANFRGVDWNSAARQELCFRQLMRICEASAGIVAQDFLLMTMAAAMARWCSQARLQICLLYWF